MYRVLVRRSMMWAGEQWIEAGRWPATGGGLAAALAERDRQVREHGWSLVRLAWPGEGRGA